MHLAGWVAAQNRITAPLLRWLARQLRMRGAPATAEQRENLADALLLKIRRAQRQSRALAVRQLAEHARAAGVEPPVMTRGRFYARDAVLSAIERATGLPDPPAGTLESVRDRVPRVTVKVLDPTSRRMVSRPVVVDESNRRDSRVVKAVTKRLSATIDRHIQEHGRVAIAEATQASPPRARVRIPRSGEQDRDTADRRDRVRVSVPDEHRDDYAAQRRRRQDTAAPESERPARVPVGWARVLTGVENCRFCAMLASRGPVYTSQESASKTSGSRGRRPAGLLFHDNCDCQIVPVFKDIPWEGQAEADRLYDLWFKATTSASAEDVKQSETRLVTRSVGGPPVRVG